MMIVKRCVLVMLLIGAFGGCSSGVDKETKRILDSPIDATSELNPGVDLSRYSTWDWLPNPNLDAVDQELKDPRIRGLIADAVQSEMFIRGYRRAEQSPDMIMNFHLAVTKIDQAYIDKMYDGSYLPDYRTDFSGSKKAKREWQEGTLVFLIFDAKTGQMIWRGSAQTEVTDERAAVSMKLRDERINKIVKMMFANFPGRS